MIFKINGKYLQVWSDDRSVCVSLGTADKLVKTLLDQNQTNKLREKLTKLSAWKNKDMTNNDN